jgi:NADPH-dependent 2,4-dienoyl-CoA reductase/sulfur reductase-like enzyme/nitrite reductase/ring-hydroxylating ferredoxin subunit
MATTSRLEGPDLALGIDAGQLGDGQMVLGHLGDEAVVVARRGSEVFAVGASCTHYGGPLAKGLFVGDTVHCPLHHACFSLRTGEALAAPAFDPIACYRVEQRDQRLFVIGKKPPAGARPRAQTALSSVVIVGGGAAGFAAAEMLRREGYAGALTMLSADAAAPCDRPNLSKDYLAGEAPEEWIPLKPPEFFAEQRIDLVLGARASSIDVAGKRVVLDGGKAFAYDALLLATGAEPVKLSIPGADLPHVHYLRTLADSRAIIAGAAKAKRAVVLGASFIGLEVTASLRTRGIEVHVVAPDKRPLERVLGPALGDFVRGVHESHDVHFHLGQTASAIEPRRVVLQSGEALDADLVVAGIGVRPALALAQAAGLTVDRGVVVDAYLQTSAPGVYAAGDIARWPDIHTGQKIRVEHWVVAERHGQVAARNILGRKEACTFVPFFWSRHYDVGIQYVGHAEQWDEVQSDGDLAGGRFRMTLLRGGRVQAVVTVNRGRESLRAEHELEQRAGAASAA